MVESLEGLQEHLNTLSIYLSEGIYGRVFGAGVRSPCPVHNCLDFFKGKSDIELTPYGAWRSLGAHLLWEQGVRSSNLLAPIFPPAFLCGGVVSACDSSLRMLPGRLPRGSVPLGNSQGSLL
jgi:hypothetical protein